MSLDSLGHYVGEVFIDPYFMGEQIVDEVLIVRHVACHDLEHVVDATANGIASQYLGHLQHYGFEAGEVGGAMPCQGNFRVNPYERTEALRVENTLVFADEAFALETLQPLEARRQAQTDRMCQGFLGNPSLGLDDFENPDVLGIEAARRVRVFHGAMSPWQEWVVDSNMPAKILDNRGLIEPSRVGAGYDVRCHAVGLVAEQV